MQIKGKQDKQKSTPDGVEVKKIISGIEIRSAITHLDDRGSLTEALSMNWEICKDPIVYVYKVMIRPTKIKGWVEHHKQIDRLFIAWGTIKVVLFDNRPESPTYKLINEFYFGEEKPGLIVIPKNVYHALQNVGLEDAYFINMPTRPYDYKDPDKYRLPIDTKKIPYKF